MDTNKSDHSKMDDALRFDELVRKVLSVPHEEIMRREAEYRKPAALNPRRRGPKPKESSKTDRGNSSNGVTPVAVD
jgi:hypothetical protein